MLDNNFIVKYITSRNCFLVLSEANTRKLSFQKIVKMNYDSKEIYCSCIISNDIIDDSYVGIPSLYAKALGIAEHQSVFISDITRLPTLSKITISPVSADDYEILVVFNQNHVIQSVYLIWATECNSETTSTGSRDQISELSSDTVQSTLLDQIRVVNKNQLFTILISKWLHVSVRVDDAEPMSYGCLANLTEVHIAPPRKQKSIEKKVSPTPTILPTPSRLNSRQNSIQNGDINGEITETRDCAELRRLKKYLTIKKPVVFRVCPLIVPQTLSKNDRILIQPFNVFMFKQDVPKFLATNSQKEIMLCKISKIEPPVDYRDNKEENNNIKNDLIVRICIVEDFYISFSDDIKSYFGDSVNSDRYPTIFVPEKTMSFFDLYVGSKLIVGNTFDFQSDVRSVELIVTDKKIKNAVQKFRTYLAEHVKYSKCLINSEILIEIEDKVFCSLRFNPPSEFCLFDEFVLRNSKIYENTDKNLDFYKNEINTKLINIDEICTEVCDFKNIVKQGETLLSMKSRNENILMIGKSGSGKTSIAKFIAQNLSQKPNFMHVVVVSCKKLKGKSVESLHKSFAQDFQNMIYYQPSLLVLDDLHIICGRTESGSEVQTQESLYFNRVGEMLSELIETHQKGNKITVIATTESTIKLNESIMSSRGKHLFRNLFRISELNKKHRETVLRNLFLQKGLIDDEIDYEDLSARTEGYVVQDLVDFANKALFESCKRNISQVEESKSITVTAFDIDAAFSNSVALALRDVQLHAPGEKDFRDVGGLEPIKKILVESMNWPSQYPDLFNNAPLRLQSGILLYGPPGVGKTLIVGAAARQCGLRLIAVKGPELLSKYIGASEQGVRNIFEKAQSARPCILFFDEFDSLAPRRGHDSTGVTDRVVNQLLTQLDGVETLTGVFVVAATSRPDLLDPALLRPGRLDRQLLCPVPDQDDRLSIMKALSRSLHFAKEVDLKNLAAETKGFSGADLQAVLYTAQLYAVEDALRAGKNIDDSGVTITNQQLEDSLKGTGASLTKQEAAKYEKIYSKFQNKKEEIDSSIKNQKATLA